MPTPQRHKAYATSKLTQRLKVESERKKTYGKKPRSKWCGYSKGKHTCTRWRNHTGDHVDRGTAFA